MTDLQKFNTWFERNIKGNPIDTSLSNDKKWFLAEMHSFYSIANSIEDSWKNKELDNSDVKQFVYPIIRRVLETFFRVLYILDDPSKSMERMNAYLDHVRYEYNKAYNDLQEIEEKLRMIGMLSQSKLNDLPIISCGHQSRIFGNVKSMLEQIKNSTNENFNSFYFWYRITSFYAHGNIDSEILHMISPNNNYFPTIKVSKLIELISNHYNALIKKYYL